MIRGLVVVAVGGAIISSACLGAVGISHHIRWHVPGTTWRIDDNDSDSDGPTVHLSGDEKIVSRTLPWAGGEKIDISVPAQVTYVQGPTAGITVTGPDALVAHVELDHDELKLNASVHGISASHALKIAITGPALHDFHLESAQTLDIRSLATDHLELDIEGAGKITAQGAAKSVKIAISGAGDAQLGNLAVADADVEIDGFGNVVVGPTGAAKVTINGAGNVVLTKRPTSLAQEINGGGHVSEPDEEKL